LISAFIATSAQAALAQGKGQSKSQAHDVQTPDGSLFGKESERIAGNVILLEERTALILDILRAVF